MRKCAATVGISSKKHNFTAKKAPPPGSAPEGGFLWIASSLAGLSLLRTRRFPIEHLRLVGSEHAGRFRIVGDQQFGLPERLRTGEGYADRSKVAHDQQVLAVGVAGVSKDLLTLRQQQRKASVAENRKALRRAMSFCMVDSILADSTR